MKNKNKFTGLFTKKKDEPVVRTENIAIDFIKNALNVIDSQLKKEIERNGFDLEKVKSGELKFSRTVQVGEFATTENYIIGATVIMSTRWGRNGFTIEVNSDSVINACLTKKALHIPVIHESGAVIDLNSRMSQRDVLIEARAQEITKEHNDKMLKL
jgi:hypothetical protein